LKIISEEPIRKEESKIPWEGPKNQETRRHQEVRPVRAEKTLGEEKRAHAVRCAGEGRKCLAAEGPCRADGDRTEITGGSKRRSLKLPKKRNDQKMQRALKKEEGGKKK